MKKTKILQKLTATMVAGGTIVGMTASASALDFNSLFSMMGGSGSCGYISQQTSCGTPSTSVSVNDLLNYLLGNYNNYQNNQNNSCGNTPSCTTPDCTKPECTTPDCNGTTECTTPDCMPDKEPEKEPEKQPDKDSTTENNVNSEAYEVFELVNKTREANGLSTLVYSSELQAAADLRAKEIVTKFSHTRPNGQAYYTAYEGTYKTIGENIASGQRSADAVMKAWMNSQGHKENILSKNYTGMAVGFYEVNGYKYWVQLFIK